MADHVPFISWGTPVRGAEKRGLEVFNETLGLYGRMQQPVEPAVDQAAAIVALLLG
jgi:hypothetical protein